MRAATVLLARRHNVLFDGHFGAECRRVPELVGCATAGVEGWVDFLGTSGPKTGGDNILGRTPRWIRSLETLEGLLSV